MGLLLHQHRELLWVRETILVWLRGSRCGVFVLPGCQGRHIVQHSLRLVSSGVPCQVYESVQTLLRLSFRFRLFQFTVHGGCSGALFRWGGHHDQVDGACFDTGLVGHGWSAGLSRVSQQFSVTLYLRAQSWHRLWL